ncbi:hypothetical protein M083_4724 [Bacteroides fragilis str. 3986 T(B)9]|nr:hypothetical protein M083_4724 [Bacteroides fragilis str. 3986 T(B)9]EYA53978.1 hypothetical protein M114_0660 [Bacteroides fragilis str. 3986 N(B)22]
MNVRSGIGKESTGIIEACHIYFFKGLYTTFQKLTIPESTGIEEISHACSF